MKRKYQMTRIKKGDYLLPSNDAKTLWRIYTYEEDGSLLDAEKPVTGTFWAVMRRPMPRGSARMEDVLSWDGDWEFWAGPLNTRKAAIDEALRVEDRNVAQTVHVIPEEVAAQRER